MLRIADLEPGQALSWTERSRLGSAKITVLVVETDGKTAITAPIAKSSKLTRCFDEPGAIWPDDRHNVRAKDSPDIFTALRRSLGYDPVVDADPAHRKTIRDEDLAATIDERHPYGKTETVRVDGKAKTAEIVVEQTKHHPWPRQSEKGEYSGRPKPRKRPLPYYGGPLPGTDGKDGPDTPGE